MTLANFVLFCFVAAYALAELRVFRVEQRIWVLLLACGLIAVALAIGL
jgi:hypothetical protein